MLARHLTLSVLLLLSIPSLSKAADAYFNAASINPTLLALPFADKSPEQLKELDYILALQQKASPKEVELAAQEREMSPEMMTLPIVHGLKRSMYPAVYHLLDNAGETSKRVTENAKDYWKTNRPYIVDQRIKPLIKAHTNYSYPSGHTSKSYTWARVMGILIPGKSADFTRKAESIAQHRVLVGMHFPHDIEGGKQISLLIMGGLLQNQGFRADLEKAQKELKEHPVVQ